MRTLEQWIQAYGADHQHPLNIVIHKVCIPLIVISLLGLMMLIPFPRSHGGSLIESIVYSWAFVFQMLALLFYALFSLRSAVVMALLTTPILWGWAHVMTLSNHTFVMALSIFAIAWIFQFIGHAIEGRKPSFLKDLQFLLIGPLWTLGRLIR